MKASTLSSLLFFILLIIVDADVPFRITQGPIRSSLGQCIDVWAANFSNGVQLNIYPCNGTPAQLWTRPSSSDLRLQTSNNMCMDVSGGSVNTVGAAVILQTCNTNSNSQKWMYDGRNVRLQFNTNLCLNIQGGQSVTNAKLIVSTCDSSSSSAWLEYSLTATAGAGLNGDTTSHLLCPVGSSVINIGGRGGAWVDQIQMTCSDGTVLGPVGGNGGSLLTPSDCVDGYSNATITYGSNIGKIEAFCRGTPSPVTSLGTSCACNGLKKYVFQANEKLIGMQVQSGTYVDSLTFIYTERLTATTQTTFHIRSRLNGFFIFGILSIQVPGQTSDYRYYIQARMNASSVYPSSAAWSWDSSTNQLSVSGDSGQYCIDYFVTNNPAEMVTNTCAQTAPDPQQRWTYDGNFLQPMTSTSSNPLCASILPPSTNSSDFQPLAVKPCTGGQDQMWDIYYPTAQPTSRPSVRPSSKPSRKPTRRPTKKPSLKPTRRPTMKQSLKPTRRLTMKPSSKPTLPVPAFRNKTGFIYDSSGSKCIDAATFTSGSQLQISDCKENYSNQKKWVRFNSTDLRLQSLSNKTLCMDASNDGRVVLSSCSKNAPSQKWYYDNGYLRSLNNMDICMTTFESALYTWPCMSMSSQRWYESPPTDKSSGYFIITGYFSTFVLVIGTFMIL